MGRFRVNRLQGTLESKGGLISSDLHAAMGYNAMSAGCLCLVWVRKLTGTTYSIPYIWVDHAGTP